MHYHRSICTKEKFISILPPLSSFWLWCYGVESWAVCVWFVWFVLHIVISLEGSTLLFNHDFGMSLVMGNVIFLFSLPSELERATRVKSSSALSQFFPGKKGCLFHHHHKLGKAALHVKDEERLSGEKSFIFALQRFFPLLRGVIRVVICTNHLLSDTLPSLAQSQYCIDGPPKSITSSLQTNKGSNQHANLLGKAWHAKKQFTTFFAKIKQKLGTVPSMYTLSDFTQNMAIFALFFATTKLTSHF